MNIVFFHKNCTDGLFSAYAFWLKFGDNAVYIPVAYKPITDMAPQEALDYLFSDRNGISHINYENSKSKLKSITKANYKDIDVYVADYSFPVKHFFYHINTFKSVTVIDHHATAIKEYTDKVPEDLFTKHCHFSQEASGAVLVYQYLFKEELLPYVFQLVSDRDLWTFKLPETKFFHYGLKLTEFKSFRKLNDNIKYSLDYIVDNGKIIEKDLLIRIFKLQENSVDEIMIFINDETHKAAIVNTFLDIASDLCNSIIVNMGYNVAIAYHISKDGRVTYSIRSSKEVDCSKIAVAMGGGGHKQASGFSSDLAFLNDMLESKKMELLVYDSNSFSQ